jgi:hypothetical protein
MGLGICAIDELVRERLVAGGSSAPCWDDLQNTSHQVREPQERMCSVFLCVFEERTTMTKSKTDLGSEVGRRDS